MGVAIQQVLKTSSSAAVAWTAFVRLRHRRQFICGLLMATVATLLFVPVVYPGRCHS